MNNTTRREMVAILTSRADMLRAAHADLEALRHQLDAQIYAAAMRAAKALQALREFEVREESPHG
jgi:outer membrane murein-binding lipoprotein Lpp